MDADDSLIVDELKKGDPAGLRLMVDKYQNRLYGLGRKLSHDLAQHEIIEIINDTLIRIIENIDSFELQSEKAFQRWLFTIFRNLVIDRLRRQQTIDEHIKLQSIDEDPVETNQGEFNKAKWELDRKIYHDYTSPEPQEHPLAPAVEKFLDGLDEKNRTILQACAMGIPHKNVAEWAEIPQKHVKVYYNRLKKRLEKYLMEIVD